MSGSLVPHIANEVFSRCPEPHKVEFGGFRDEKGSLIDNGIALYFPAPRSFTGEDVLEIQGHGGRVVQEVLCERIQSLGARIARPGEFTERAFLNDRIDLAQAEAVADLINASSRQAVRASARSLSGEFSREVLGIDHDVLELRVYVEGAIDFAEEEIDFLADESVLQRTQAIRERLGGLLHNTEVGATLQRGLQVVIAGAPNVGKSSLLNALLNTDRAIVSDTAGTTRDTLDATIHLDGLPVFLTDTAGLHAGGDAIEAEGMERARKAVELADLVLWVVDDRDPNSDHTFSWDCPTIVVRNKCDLTGNDAGQVDGSTLRISALKRKGLSLLRERIADSAGYEVSDDAFAGRPRHVAALKGALGAVDQAKAELERKSGEVAAEALREVHLKLGEIVGETTTDDLLGEIFSKFCIGK